MSNNKKDNAVNETFEDLLSTQKDIFIKICFFTAIKSNYTSESNITRLINMTHFVLLLIIGLYCYQRSIYYITFFICNKQKNLITLPSHNKNGNTVRNF